MESEGVCGYPWHLLQCLEAELEQNAHTLGFTDDDDEEEDDDDFDADDDDDNDVKETGRSLAKDDRKPDRVVEVACLRV